MAELETELRLVPSTGRTLTEALEPMSKGLPSMKAGPPAFPIGEGKTVSDLSPEPRPVEEASPQEEVVGLEAPLEAVVQEADVSAVAEIIAS